MKKIIVVFILMLTVITLSACNNKTTHDEGSLKSVKNATDLARLIDNSATRSNDYLFAEDDAVDETAGDGNEANTHSETNVQVDGIDEGDIIKTDGNRIYYVRNQYLTVVEVNDGEMTTLLNQSHDEGNIGYYRELYLTDDKLIVIGNKYEEDLYSARPEMDYMWYSYYSGDATVDVYDKASLTIEDTFTISGNITTTRLKDDVLYVVTSAHAETRDDDEDIRPTFTINDDTITPDYNEIVYLEGVPTHTFTILTSIDLDGNDLDYTIFLGLSYWNQVYMSHEGIYLASTYYVPNEDESDDDVVTDWFDYMKGVVIHYDIQDDGTLDYFGQAEYDGQIINQFAMDEHDNMLRLVTTEGWGDDVINRLYIFEKTTEDGESTFVRRALLDEGIGKPRETVRSVRFNNAYVTVVTFEQTDPFYMINLENPDNPRIEGELEITGFSTYQHPWEENRVIGIGYETDEDGRTVGLKLALYDTSDAENPTVINEPLILLNEENNWQYAEALFNHKAILVSNQFDFIGFSINAYHATEDNYGFVSDYVVFSIDETRTNPITITDTITHVGLFGSNTDVYNYGIQRAVTINNHLFVLSQGAITQHDITDNYTLIDDIELELR
ncbi:MAG: beta-propeller domain-containing protein [Bacillota bacterium]